MDQFVLRHSALLQKVDHIGRFAILFLMRGDREVLMETAYTALNLLSFYQEHVFDKYGKLNNEKLKQDPRFSTYFSYNKPLKLFQHLEVVLEMITTSLLHHKKNRKYYLVLLCIEVIKSIFKLNILLKSGVQRYLDSSILPQHDSQLQYESIGNEEEEAEAGEQRLVTKNEDEKPFHIGKRSGRILPKMKPSTEAQQYQQLRKVSIQLLDSNSNSSSKEWIGELLFIFRPVVYVLGLYLSRNKNSWSPLLISFGMDLLSQSLTSQSSSFYKKNVIVEDEHRRRRFLLFYYLLRNPLFDKLIQPCLKWILSKNFLFFNFIIHNLIEYLQIFQSYYFYTSAS